MAPTAEPLVPGTLRLLDNEQQTSKVSAHTKVVKVPLNTPRERRVLIFHRMVAMATTPLVDRLDRPSQTRTACLAEHPPTSLAGPRPVEREPEEVGGPNMSFDVGELVGNSDPTEQRRPVLM